ncbi:MAG: glycosyltransferase [Gaiellaceae bacterium]
MRAVLVSPEYPPADHMGGIGTNAAVLARALVERGAAVGVVTRGDSPGTRDEDGVTVVRLDHRWVPQADAERLLANRRIASAAGRFRPDVVQAAEWQGEGWWLARFARVPVVTRLATPTYILEELNEGRPDPRNRLVRALERDQARRSAAVYAPTRAIADRVAADWTLPREQIRVIPNPVDVGAVRRAAEREPPLELPERYLCFIGRMEPRKGVAVLGDALPAVLGAHPGLHAVLIGREPAEQAPLLARFSESTRAVADRVHLTGELPREEALAVVARSQLVVLPSLWENFGHVCVEAMALGRPVVASDVGGFAEIVSDRETGWLVAPGDPEELASALAGRLGDEAALGRIGEAARRRAEDFAPEALVDRVVELYEEVASERSGRFEAGIYVRGYRRYFRADDRRDPFHALYEAKRRALVDDFAGRERLRLLDVGGGYGRIAGPLAELHDVTLCDISPEMLEEARRRWPGLALVEADARRLPFGDSEFDAVLAVDLLPHLPDLAEGLAELARVARPGGEVVFDTTNASPWWVLAYPSYVNWRPRRLLRTMRGGGVLPEWQALVRHHHPGDVRRALETVGLAVARAQAFGPRWSPKWHLWWTTRR